MVDPFQASITAAAEEAAQWGRQTEAGLQPIIVEVLAPTRSGDAVGGTTEAWNTVVLTFPGRVNSVARPEGVNVGGGRIVRQLWDIAGPTGISVSTSARLRVNGTQYAVVGDDEPRSYSVAAHILCYEVQPT